MPEKAVFDTNQTPHEERINGLTHMLGIAFSLAAGPYVLYKAYMAGSLSLFASVGIFLAGMLLVYTFSTLYHLANDQKRKFLLLKLDHISIYFLIAGTYTPVIIKYTDTSTATLFLSIMWSIVVFGIFYKLFFINRSEVLSLILYLALGWMVVFVARPIAANMPLSVFWWVLLGGLSYTAGVYFFVKDHRKYYHAIWHLFVLGGTASHFFAINELINLSS
ncbi:MAG: hemolysin III family protein [Saprospiraceae bacterium]|nr:hemolysin III family protein [Saprospiraceae bacterium]